MKKVATIILVIALAYSGVYAIMVISATQFIVGSSFEGITGKELSSVQDQGYVTTLINVGRYMGVFALTTVILLFVILFTGFRNTEKWAWWAILFVGVGIWAYGIITNILEKDTLNSLLHIIGAVIFLVGILLPVKVFFTKKA
jgi:hypothetical protein